MSALNPKRTVAELKELRSLTSDENGAQRVAFTKIWLAARDWLGKKLESLPVESHTDAAGNLWTSLRGQSERALLIGGHIDSVPNGGGRGGPPHHPPRGGKLRRLHTQKYSQTPLASHVRDS